MDYADYTYCGMRNGGYLVEEIKEGRVDRVFKNLT